MKSFQLKPEWHQESVKSEQVCEKKINVQQCAALHAQRFMTTKSFFSEQGIQVDYTIDGHVFYHLEKELLDTYRKKSCGRMEQATNHKMSK